MSGKLDQSLDDITSAQRRAGPRAGARNPRRAATTARARAPVGGIQKKTKVQVRKPVAKTTQASAPAARSAKITVSNLPVDVTVQQIKDFFIQQAGPIKSVVLDYNEHGKSRGSATIIFRNPSATDKATALNGILIDKKPIKIEINLLPGQEYIPVPAKSLADRATQPKNKPKSAAHDKPKSAVGKKATGAGVSKVKSGSGAAAGGDTKRARNARQVPKKKTVAELDEEMSGYFTASADAAAPEAAAPEAAAMEEDIM